MNRQSEIFTSVNERILDGIRNLNLISVTTSENNNGKPTKSSLNTLL